ncbi:hypothetical protein OBBRIDRAFT_832854 [Obba rivulosa]|uniref:DUF6534 domain-containing protein n=1 Tax=Obba rivulosa TaxID=1052685 RepID=A0A8E2DP77_9APHY|nr:hypothetical protein OBBRIDRAFT_832854 [Obba rivulosa]
MELMIRMWVVAEAAVHVLTVSPSIFSIRIWNISRIDWKASIRRYVVVFTVLACSLAEFAIVLLVATRLAMTGDYKGLSGISVSLYIGLSFCAVGDIVIAYAQIVVLQQCRTGFRRTDSVVKILMLYSINTALLTTICAICNLVTFAALPGTLLYEVFYFMLPKLLLNSCLATLNARRDLRNVLTGPSQLVTIPVPPHSTVLRFEHPRETESSKTFE